MSFIDPKFDREDAGERALHFEFWAILGIVTLSWLQAIWAIL